MFTYVKKYITIVISGSPKYLILTYLVPSSEYVGGLRAPPISERQQAVPLLSVQVRVAEQAPVQRPSFLGSHHLLLLRTKGSRKPYKEKAAPRSLARSWLRSFMGCIQESQR